MAVGVLAVVVGAGIWRGGAGGGVLRKNEGWTAFGGDGGGGGAGIWWGRAGGGVLRKNEG